MIKRRIKLVEIDPRYLEDVLLTTGDDCIILDIKGVPKGSRLINLGYDSYRNLITCLFEHKSFDEVPECEVIPRLNIEFNRYYV
jgi:hypothetical protein